MSYSRHFVWRDNESASRTVSYCITRGCFVSNGLCHPICRPSNEQQGSEERRGLRACKATQHFEIQRCTVSAGSPTVCNGAIPISRLEVAARAECHPQRRPATENHRDPQCASHYGH